MGWRGTLRDRPQAEYDSWMGPTPEDAIVMWTRASALYWMNRSLATQMDFWFKNTANNCSGTYRHFLIMEFEDKPKGALITQITTVTDTPRADMLADFTCQRRTPDPDAAARSAKLKEFSARNVDAAEAALTTDASDDLADFLSQHTEDVVVEDGTSPVPMHGREGLLAFYNGFRAIVAQIEIFNQPSVGIPGASGQQVAWQETVYIVTKAGCRATQGVVCSQKLTEQGLVAWHGCFWSNPELALREISCPARPTKAKKEREPKEKADPGAEEAEDRKSKKKEKKKWAKKDDRRREKAERKAAASLDDAPEKEGAKPQEKEDVVEPAKAGSATEDATGQSGEQEAQDAEEEGGKGSKKKEGRPWKRAERSYKKDKERKDKKWREHRKPKEGKASKGDEL